MIKIIISIFIILNILWIDGVDAVSLDTGRGVRVRGMGDTFTGVADDINAVSYNPAGLGQFEQGEIYLTYNNYYNLDLLNTFYFSIASPGIAHGTFCFSYKKLGVGEKVKFMGEYSESLYNVSYGVEVVENIYAGANAKLLRINHDNKASAISYDAGLLFRTWEKHLSIGAIVKNLNTPKMTWDDQTEENIDYLLRAGIGIRPNNNLLIAADLDDINLEDYNFHVGAEYWFINRTIAPRVGLAYLQNNNIVLNVGGSVRYRYLRVDYAFEKHNELGYDHLFGVLVKF